MNIAPKTVGGTTGAVFSNALVAVVLYFTKQNPPPDIVAALCTLVGGIGAFVGAYIMPHVEPLAPKGTP